MSFVFPPPPLLFAMAGAVLMPLLLLLLSKGPRALRRPGPRLKASILAGVIVWLVLLGVSGKVPGVFDGLAGAAILLAAAILSFILWSLIAWGFTINMLGVLAKAGRPLGPEAWAAAYSGGKGLDEICRDRMGLVLGSGFACEIAPSVYRITRAGRLFAMGLRLARALYGVR